MIHQIMTSSLLTDCRLALAIGDFGIKSFLRADWHDQQEQYDGKSQNAHTIQALSAETPRPISAKWAKDARKVLIAAWRVG